MKNRHVQAVMQAAQICKLRDACGIPQPDNSSKLTPAERQIVEEFRATLHAAGEAQQAEYDAMLVRHKAEYDAMLVRHRAALRDAEIQAIHAALARLRAPKDSTETEHDSPAQPNERGAK